MDIITRVKTQENEIAKLQNEIASIKDRLTLTEIITRSKNPHRYHLIGLIGLFLGSLAFLTTIIHMWLVDCHK